MHEFGLCDGIIEAVQRRAAGRPVARVRVRSRNAPSSRRSCVSTGLRTRSRRDRGRTRGGRARRNSGIRHMSQPVEMSSRANDIIAVCPKCGGTNLDFTAGEELILESIEYEAGRSGSNAT